MVRIKTGLSGLLVALLMASSLIPSLSAANESDANVAAELADVFDTYRKSPLTDGERAEIEKAVFRVRHEEPAAKSSRETDSVFLVCTEGTIGLLIYNATGLICSSLAGRVYVIEFLGVGLAFNISGSVLVGTLNTSRLDSLHEKYNFAGSINIGAANGISGRVLFLEDSFGNNLNLYGGGIGGGAGLSLGFRVRMFRL